MLTNFFARQKLKNDWSQIKHYVLKSSINSTASRYISTELSTSSLDISIISYELHFGDNISIGRRRIVCQIISFVFVFFIIIVMYRNVFTEIEKTRTRLGGAKEGFTWAAIVRKYPHAVVWDGFLSGIEVVWRSNAVRDCWRDFNIGGGTFPELVWQVDFQLVGVFELNWSERDF